MFPSHDHGALYYEDMTKAKQMERDQMFKEFINGIVLSNKKNKKELQKHYDKNYK